MPELPEVETVRRGLDAVMTGRRLGHVTVNRFDLRRRLPADFAARLAGRTVTAVGRRGKYLLIHFEDGGVLLIHLGMPGRMVIDPAGAPTGDRAAPGHRGGQRWPGNPAGIRRLVLAQRKRLFQHRRRL